jgi:hypothetical protein
MRLKKVARGHSAASIHSSKVRQGFGRRAFAKDPVNRLFAPLGLLDAAHSGFCKGSEVCTPMFIHPPFLNQTVRDLHARMQPKLGKRHGNCEQFMSLQENSPRRGVRNEWMNEITLCSMTSHEIIFYAVIKKGTFDFGFVSRGGLHAAGAIRNENINSYLHEM